MRFFISFFLSIISYTLIFAFLYFVLIYKKPKKEEVLIHTAILQNVKVKTHRQKKAIKTVKKTKVTQKPKKNVQKKGSVSSLTKGGNIDFNDIFKNVKENVPTKPLNFKKNLTISRFKGLSEIEKRLSQINVDVTVKGNNNLKKEKVNEIVDKIGKIWYEISNIPGEYAKINIISKSGSVDVFVLDSNLNESKQQELIEKIKQLKFDKNFDLNILFQTKVNK